MWDLPGGHVESGEEPGAALARELREELGIVVEPPTRPADGRVSSDDMTTDIWLIDHWNGDPHNAAPAEHDVLGWFGPTDLSDLELAHLDYLDLFERLVFG